MTNQSGSTHDSSYEWKSIVLLSLGFGLVGLDRWIIAPIAPAIMEDLGISPQQMNFLIAILGITWGVAALFMGSLADKLGRRKIIIPSIIIFSLLSGFSGFAMGFASLFLIRGAMGIAEGAFQPASFAATADAAKPRRLGFAQGFQQSMFALIGLGFGPIIATQLLEHVGWRGAFMMVAVPGFVVAFLLWLVLREPKDIPGKQTNEASGNIMEKASIKSAISVHNVRVAMAGLFCAMCGIFVLSANVPIYLSSYLELPGKTMGFVTSAIGFGGFAGLWLMPTLSDYFGRKLTSIVGFALAAVSLVGFIKTGADPVPLFGFLFAASAFSFGMLSLITGPISAEAAPKGMISTTTGLVGGAGEILGGGLGLIVAGIVIAKFGLPAMLYLALGGLVLGIFVMMLLTETAPRVLAKKASKR